MARKKKTGPTKEKFTLYLRGDDLKALQRMAEASDGEYSVAHFVRKAVQEFVGKKKRR
ncbi:MAG: hypothetical protein O7H41_15140 [Planctomycetota bacterium]|nr:hypothetical protein [Planctomycetota bacterium]